MKSPHIGPVHTETFPCVFVLFQVMSWLFSIPLENSKQYKNAGKRFRVYGALNYVNEHVQNLVHLIAYIFLFT